jgi:hypothetical protein
MAAAAHFSFTSFGNIAIRRRFSFPAEALGDEFPEVWKEAIEGLVAMPCDESLQGLRAALNAVAEQRDAAERREWIQEAIAQVSENL